LIVFSVIALVAFWLTRPAKDLCTDRIQDNHETGIDCGGFCDSACAIPSKPASVKDIVVNWVKFAKSGEGRYTLVADLSNNNASWGVSSVGYVFTYYSNSGMVLGTREGKASITPKGNTTAASVKYIIEDAVLSNTPIAKVELALKDYQWNEIKNADDIDNLNEAIINISGKDFHIDDAIKAYVATGTTKNTSKYDFYKVGINVVVFGKDNQLLAAGKTTQLTMATGSGWGFTVAWPNLKIDKSTVDHVDYRAETDVFDKNNFMKAYRSDN
jgi:hypothetical protein